MQTREYPGRIGLSPAFRIRNVARQIECLKDDKHHRQTEHAEELEVDPGVAVEMAHDVEIGRAHPEKEEHPAQIQPPPHLFRQGQVGTHEPLDGGPLADELAGQKRRAEEPVDNGRLPLDELFVLKIEGQTAEDDNDYQGDELHRGHLAGADPGDGDLHQGGGDGNAGGDIDIEKFVGDEKGQYRKKIKKEFHGQ